MSIPPLENELLLLIENDAVVFGLLMLCLGFVFYTSLLKDKFWTSFYKIFPALLMCYMLPALFNSSGIISPEISQIYFVASRFIVRNWEI